MTGLRGLGRDAAPLVVLEALGLLLALALLPWLMRTLGVEGFGRYAVGVAAGSMLLLVADYGFNQLGPRLAATLDSHGDARASAAAHSAVLRSVQRVRFGLALLAATLGGMTLGIWPQAYNYIDVAAGSLGALVGAALWPQWWLQGTQRFRLLAAGLAGARLVCFALTLLLVREPQDAALAVALQTGVPAMAGGLVLLDRRFRAQVFASPSALTPARQLLADGTPFFLSAAAVGGYTSGVPLLVAALTTPTTVGIFGAADRLRAALQALLAPIGTAAYPRFARALHRSDASTAWHAVRPLLTVQLALAAAAAVGLAAFAAPVLRTIAGPDFHAAAPVAAILGLALLCTAVSNSLGVQALLPLGEDRAFSAVLVCGLVVGIAVLTWAAPRWGAVGAAVAVVSAELFVAVGMATVLVLRLRRLDDHR